MVAVAGKVRHPVGGDVGGKILRPRHEAVFERHQRVGLGLQPEDLRPGQRSRKRLGAGPAGRPGVAIPGSAVGRAGGGAEPERARRAARVRQRMIPICRRHRIRRVVRPLAHRLLADRRLSAAEGDGHKVPRPNGVAARPSTTAGRVSPARPPPITSSRAPATVEAEGKALAVERIPRD